MLSRMAPNLAGASVMMASMAAFTVSDTMIKATGGAVPLFQLMTIRAALTTGLLVVLARALGVLSFRLPAADRGLVALRCLGEIGAAYFFITALLNMPLANLTAILQVLPLTVTLGAALLFREAIGWRRMLAILVGFSGMLLIVRPGPEGFTIHSAYALAAVASVTLRDLATRRMSKTLPSMTVTVLTSAAVLAAFGAASLTIDWVPVSGVNAALIGASSVCIMAGYFCSVQVMRMGDVSFIAPFRYTGLLWALILGWAVFGHWPTPLTLLGAGIVVGSGLFTLYRERASLRR
jgi:S-adenosylmethionine uptake transporter